MNLREWLCKNRITQKQFCKMIGYTASHVRNVSYGRNKPSPRMSEAIKKATNGEVKGEEL